MGEKAVSRKRNAVGHETRVSALLPQALGILGEELHLGQCQCLFRELAHGIQMRISRDNVLPNG